MKKLLWFPILLWPVAVLAYPEFQANIAKRSGRAVNCALCHNHADGPEGAAYGQIGSLTPEQIKQLQAARAAFEPGNHAENPLLNPFGNYLIQTLGKKKVLEMRRSPAGLPAALDQQHDFDQDGIPDAQELRDGTHPLIKTDGRPWLLFRHNFRANFGQILLTAAGTLAGLYGLKHLLHGFHAATGTVTEEVETAFESRELE